MAGKVSIPFQVSEPTPHVDLPRIFKIAVPATIEPLVVHASYMGFIWFVARYGNEAFAAYGIGLTLMTIPQVTGYDFSMAAAALVGMNLGAGRLLMAAGYP